MRPEKRALADTKPPLPPPSPPPSTPGDEAGGEEEAAALMDEGGAPAGRLTEDRGGSKLDGGAEWKPSESANDA